MAGRKRRSTKTGMPPGALVHLGERKIDHAAIGLIEYGPDNLGERQFQSIEESRNFEPTQPVLWLNVHGLHEPEVMAEIGRRFKLHPLVLEDILNTDQRPKLDDYGDYLFLVARFFDYDDKDLTVTSEQVSLVIGRNFVLTFQERPTGNFNPIRDRLRENRGQIRRLGADYLAYALLDTVVDRYFAVLEDIGERAEQLEEELMLKADAARAGNPALPEAGNRHPAPRRLAAARNHQRPDPQQRVLRRRSTALSARHLRSHRARHRIAGSDPRPDRRLARHLPVHHQQPRQSGSPGADGDRLDLHALDPAGRASSA